jgi:hypothetical protein
LCIHARAAGGGGPARPGCSWAARTASARRLRPLRWAGRHTCRAVTAAPAGRACGAGRRSVWGDTRQALAVTRASAFIMSTNCSKQMSASWGPGEASGWY